MYHIDIITIAPHMIAPFLSSSILNNAQQKGIVKINLHNLRDYTTYNHKQVDDYPYGGGAGMVLMPEPLGNAIEYLQKQRQYDETIYMTPDGLPFSQPMANKLSLLKNILILCGRYKGVDERIRKQYITKEISIGDYVITGGELAAVVVTDAITRLLPGAINDSTSALSDSFQDSLLAPPLYTRPKVYKGMHVPEVLLSGHEQQINQWRLEKSQERTKEKRPDMLKNIKN